MNPLLHLVRGSPAPVALPIAVYPGIALTGARVRDVVTDPGVQAAAVTALHQRYATPVVLSAMDLSAEAEAFGCEVHLLEDEIPTVVGRLVTSPAAGHELPVPPPGAKRTAVFLETVRRLKALPSRPLVLGGCIGPFSLASRLVGMTEALGFTITDPERMHLMTGKATEFLSAYVLAFKAAGADGVLMAEPGAGLLSPKAMRTYSSAYIRRIVAAADDASFTLVLHNCAAKLVHLPAVLESGARVCHFGAPMDLGAALAQVPPEVVLCGNLDPTRVFFQSKPDEVAAATRQLLEATRSYRNFVVSSGCDIPPGSPLANLDAFYRVVSENPATAAG